MPNQPSKRIIKKPRDFREEDIKEASSKLIKRHKPELYVGESSDTWPKIAKVPNK